MPAKRNRSNTPASDENRYRDKKNGRNSPGRPYDANENLQKPYQGYDEERTSLNPGYEQDFDVDENDIQQRQNEYGNVNENMHGRKPGSVKRDDLDANKQDN